MAKVFVLLSRSAGKGTRGSDADFSIIRSSYVCIYACKRKNRAREREKRGTRLKGGAK